MAIVVFLAAKGEVRCSVESDAFIWGGSRDGCLGQIRAGLSSRAHWSCIIIIFIFIIIIIIIHSETEVT